jgi:UDP-glucose 4-epimerase
MKKKCDNHKVALVTGGAGFIGSNLVRRLLEKNYSVVVLDNFSTGYKENLVDFEHIRVIEGDIQNSETVGRAVKGVDVIFHLAANVGNLRSLSDPAFDSRVNVIGTINILEAARKRGIQKVVYSSSAAIFGEPKSLPIDENHPTFPDSPYGVSKLSGEKHCLCYAKLYNMHIVCLRYFNVYGRNQRYDAYGNVIPIFTDRLLKGEPLIIYGDGEQIRDFVNVRDVVETNLLAAESKGLSGVFNIGCGVPITINKLAEVIQKAAGKRVKIKYASARKGEVKYSLADIAKAKKLLNYTPNVYIYEGLKEYIDWASSEH